MRDVLPELLSRWQAGERVAVASVIATWSSAPRQPGAAMLVSTDGTVVGSVSGGCVEGAVYEEATAVLASGQPRRLRYGVSDDDAFAVGLTCGGIIDIFVEPISPDDFSDFDLLAADVRASRPVTVATVVDGPAPDSSESVRLGRRVIVRPDSVSGSLGSPRLDDAVRDDARGLLEKGRTGVLRYGPDGERRVDTIGVFVASYAPRPHLIVFGAIDFAAAVARIGSYLGYRVTVCDARPVFATNKRFPDADEVVVEWPHKYLQHTATDDRTVICVLTHDPKFDVPLLQLALNRPVGYIGAMGSRRTNDDRLKRLRELGVSEVQLAKLHAPIGLDLGARTPEETAVSIAAEIIAMQWQGSGRPLRDLDRAIHRNPDSG